MFIGIDPGVQNIGVASIDYTSSLNFVKYLGVGDSENDGYIDIVKAFGDILSEVRAKYGEYPKIFIEKPFFTPKTLPRNVRTLEMIGLLKYAAYHRAGIPDSDIIMLSPATIKKSVTGNGRAVKEDIIHAVCKEFKIHRNLNSHEADAIAVAITGRQQCIDSGKAQYELDTKLHKLE